MLNFINFAFIHTLQGILILSENKENSYRIQKDLDNDPYCSSLMDFKFVESNPSWFLNIFRLGINISEKLN